ncbi:InlB B-repeat-containing protein, partial [Porphyromonas uenonis]|uniref:InlB B-repeat-containing protein n=1 Tax=Porphyromonas uenonis TaxID=281920 RepID=UPI00288A998B
MKQRLLRNNWTLLGFLLITMLASLSYAHASVRGAGTQATTGCLVTFSETNEWGTIKAYYFDVENGRGKVFFKSGARLPKGTAVNFEATVSKGWEVGSWTVNDKVTKGRSRTRLNFYLEKDSKIALTCKRLKQYKISYASDPADGGTIKVYWKKQVGYYGDEVEEVSIPDGGTVLDKTKVYIEARPKAGYRFDRYVINGKSQTGDSSDKNTYVLTPTEDLTIRGIFISTRPVTYAIHFAQPAHGHLKLFAGEQE